MIDSLAQDMLKIPYAVFLLVRDLKTCTIVGGPVKGSKCVFPFIFGGVTYKSCIEWTFGGQPEGTLWCSTKVDESGVHVSGGGNYGFCGEDCPRDLTTNRHDMSPPVVSMFKI